MTLDIHLKSLPQSKSLPYDSVTHLQSLKICLLIDKVIQKQTHVVIRVITSLEKYLKLNIILIGEQKSYAFSVNYFHSNKQVNVVSTA